ncbi:ATP synthase subunit s, mitochondrial isoform 1-T2 [Chlamydotis macqueenii]
MKSPIGCSAQGESITRFQGQGQTLFHSGSPTQKNMVLLGKLVQPVCSLSKVPALASCRHFWGWLNAVFNKVDYERIQAVGPDRAASEWLLRCGALVRYQGYEKWQQDYNGLPTGPLGKYKIEAINATESCIMYRGFDYLDGLEHVTEIKLQKCIYIRDECLQRLSETKNLQKSLLQLKIISCGNVTDKGIIALHKLTNLEYLFLSDLPGIREKQTTVRILQQALPDLEVQLDLE